MKRLLHLLAIACMFAPPLQAQRVLVSGKVMDAQTKESLQGANIYLRKQGKGVVSDGQGNFQLSLSSSQKAEISDCDFAAFVWAFVRRLADIASRTSSTRFCRFGN